MSADNTSTNYSLTPSNPAVTTPPTSVIYTGVTGGNTLNLIIGNNFGFDMTIGGGSLGGYLFVDISASMLDAESAAAITAASPWQIKAVTPPAAPEPQMPGFWRLSLEPPAAGMTITNGGTITITLSALSPIATGTALIDVYYQFDDTSSDDLSASANLSSLAPPNPANPPLIGDNEALRLTLYVNGGVSANPIMVSATPVNDTTAVDNQLHFNLLYQAATSPARLLAGDDESGLVTQWNQEHPPAIRIFFPYQSPSDPQPAAFDLTDSLPKGATGYNPLTSAWNIQGTLDPNNPDITTNTFWQFAPDLNAGVPTWLVTPTTANTNLFTVVESSSTEPGPFLDLYLEEIVSALPIDAESPETVVYVQWNNFPGFSDGLVAYPLQKSPLTISGFTGTVQRTDTGPQLMLEWTTSSATSYCLVSDDSAQQRAQAQGENAYVRSLTSDQPLRSAYTLTAYGPDRVTNVSRRIAARWQLNDQVAPTNATGVSGLNALPDGQTLLALQSNSGNIELVDADTLRPTGGAIGGPAKISVFDVTSDGKTIYAADFAGSAYAFDVKSQQLITGGVNFSLGASAPFVEAISKGNVNVAFATGVTIIGNTTYGANQVIVLNAETLQPVEGSPAALPDPPGVFAIGAQTDRYYLPSATGLLVLDGTSLQPVAGSPVAAAGASVMLAVATDESAVYGLAVQNSTPRAFLFKMNASTLQVERQIPLDIFPIPVPFVVLTGMILSCDQRLLFVSGVSLSAMIEQQLVPRFLVYDTETLEEVSWSPLSLGTLVPFTFTMSPDGTRLFVLAAPDIDNPNGGLVLSAIDPEFV